MAPSGLYARLCHAFSSLFIILSVHLLMSDNRGFTHDKRSDYSSGYRNNIIYAKYPVDGGDAACMAAG